MLASVAIAMGFSYPTIALSENPTAGIASFPNHVWTTAKPVDDGSVGVDVEMRQIWVHGSYMDALNKDVLKRALTVQNSLVGDEDLTNLVPTLKDKLGSDSLQWAYHSPLMYWNNSAEAIDADTDILKTINTQKYSSSTLNVQLRPASVFAGKKFDRTQLRAADALVISFLNNAGDVVGKKWQERMQALSNGACENCTLFPSDGHVTRHRVYQFSFTPLSFSEHIALTFAYSAMAIYVLLSLRRMRAFHSRFGLVVTAITQMTCSILSSFTICGILKINLAMIPQNVYPFVVLVLGVENMFRLINAVLAYPPTMATEMRIANALGDIGPLSVAAAAQNLTILALLSTLVSPGVAAFCAFAAIATLFDAFFLLTFFVAVLSVDIRRLELQDALAARHNRPRQRRRPSPPPHAFLDALIQGRLPFSTRMAGTAVTTTFILALNYHFFEHKERATTLRDLLGLLVGSQGDDPIVNDHDTFAPPPINASLTPAEWMRMQDFDTAKEVMTLANPDADSFVIRLFAPLVVVLGGSDRTGVSHTGRAWTQALRSFAIHHFYPVAVAIVFIVAFVCVLMNYLLYNEAGDEENEFALERMDDTLTSETILLPHRLDIVKIASNGNGQLVTIGLDRTISITSSDQARLSHVTVSVAPSVLANINWPVRNLAVDESGDWVACHCADDRILAYNCKTSTFATRLVQYPDDHPATIFAFTSLPSTTGSQLFFIVLTSGGRLAMTGMESGLSLGADLSQGPLMGASVLDTTQGRQLFLVTAQSEMTTHVWSSGKWIAASTARLEIQTKDGHPPSQVGIQMYSDLDTELVIVTTSTCATFINITTLAPVASFDLSAAGAPVDKLLMGTSRKCPTCGHLALRRIAAVGSVGESCNLTTWSVHVEGEAYMCLTQSSRACRPFSSADKESHTIASAGSWSAVNAQAILGLRKRPSPEPARDRERPTTSKLRLRRHVRQQSYAQAADDTWEAYRMGPDGNFQTLEVPVASDGDAALYVSNAGPIVALDSQAIAVAFGNTVKVIRNSRITGAQSRRVSVRGAAG
jgi:hypothetical protein